MKKKERDCEHFHKCSAPICPLNINPEFFWYPDEEICAVRQFAELPWIKNQRKIAKKAKNKDFYFTHEMLSHNCIVRGGIEGLDPDNTTVNDKRAVNKWLKEHPEKTEYSNERKEMIKNLGHSFRQNTMDVKTTPLDNKIQEQTALRNSKKQLTNAE